MIRSIEAKRSASPLEQKAKTPALRVIDSTLSDEELREIIANNVQRLPRNDNSIVAREVPPKLGIFRNILSGIAFAALFVFATILLGVFRLLPQSSDSDY